MDRLRNPPRPTPGFWIVALLGLLWNGFGAYLYTRTSLGDAAMLADAPPAMRDYVATMPIWAHAGWALGIWSSLAGSVLMLARSRRAVGAFWISLVGALVSFAAQGAADVLEPAQPALILAVIGFQLWYCHRAAQAGLLR